MFNNNRLSSFTGACALIGWTLTITACGGGGFGQDYDSPFVEPTPIAEPTPAPQPVPELDDYNILDNAYLELGGDDEFTGWTVINGADAVSAVVAETCSGRGMKVESAGGNPWDVQIHSSPLTLSVAEGDTPNQYTAMMWVKSSVAETSVRFSTVEDAPQYQQEPATVGTEWQKVVFTFNAIQEDTAISLDVGASTATILIDDVRVVKGDTPDEVECPRLEITNGTFEMNPSMADENIVGWIKKNGAENLVLTDVDSHDGELSLKATGIASDAWRVQIGSLDIATKLPDSVEGSNISYEVALWAKGATEGGKLQISTAATAGAQYSGLKDVGTDWEEITWSFSANDALTSIVLDLGATDVVLFIDDITIKEVVTAAE